MYQKEERLIKDNLVFFMVVSCLKFLKIGSNWSVQSVGSEIGDEFSWVNLLKSLRGQNWSKIGKIRLNRPKPLKPKNQSRFCKIVRFKKIHQIDHYLFYL